MIGTLRRKFILAAVIALASTLVVLCAVVNIAFYLVNTAQADEIIQLIQENDGGFPDESIQDDPYPSGAFQITPETAFETRYFIVHVSSNGQVLDGNVEHIAATDRNSAETIAEAVLTSGRTTGYYDHYRFGVFEHEDTTRTVVVLDRFLSLQTCMILLRASIAAALSCLLIVTVLLIPLSKHVVKPFANNLQRQRQFVTDASHELKTPLAIIVADAEVMEATSGSNQWIRSIKSQAMRLDSLTKALVELVRADEAMGRSGLVPLSLSQTVERVTWDFLPLAEARNMELQADIEPNICIDGSPDEIERLCSILLDNAVKYCDEGGTMHISLVQHRKKVVLTVANPCREFDPAEASRLFDHFYRADTSRARETGGYGVGLSIARAIAERHNAKLNASAQGDTVTFTFTVPLSASTVPESK